MSQTRERERRKDGGRGHGTCRRASPCRRGRGGSSGGDTCEEPAPAEGEAPAEGDESQPETAPTGEEEKADDAPPEEGDEEAKEEDAEAEKADDVAEEPTEATEAEAAAEEEPAAAEGAEGEEAPAPVEEDEEAKEEDAEAEKADDAAEDDAEATDAEAKAEEEPAAAEAEGEASAPAEDGGEDVDEETQEGGDADAEKEGEAEEGEEGVEAEDAEGEEGEMQQKSPELDPVSPGINERDIIKNLLAEAYEEENELKEVSHELEQKILLLENFRTRRGSVIGLTSSIVHDIEARYLSSLLSWSDHMQEEARIAQHYQTALMDLRMRLEEKDKRAMRLEDEYAMFKEEVIKMAEYSRTGKGIPNHVVNEVNLMEDEKEIEKSKVRSRNIHLQHQLKDLESRLKQKEELAEGLHLIDFEQLKIENQSLNEKIEERNEELLKLRKKTTTTVQVLTHLKEKLQFVQKKNNILDSELGDLDMQLSSKRDKLQKEKQSREKARDDIMKLREKSGLVTDPVLLQDVDKQKQKREFLANKVEELQQKYLKLEAEMTFTSVV